MASPEPQIRRLFKDLHHKDQQIKQTKRLCIEKNWSCSIDDCLPEVIRPRIELKRGAKARIGEDIGTEAWWNWSVELLKALEELSSMSINELDYARELLVIEVQHRQANPKSAQRKIMEVLLGDAQRVVEEQRRRVANAYEEEDVDEDGDMGMGYGAGVAKLEQQSVQGDNFLQHQRRFIANGEDLRPPSTRTTLPPLQIATTPMTTMRNLSPPLGPALPSATTTVPLTTPRIIAAVDMCLSSSRQLS